MSIRRPLVGAGVGLLLASGLGVAAATAAAAATPTCTTSETITAGRVSYSIPATSTGSTNCTMKPGDSGGGVQMLQVTLNGCYGANLAVDGRFGSKTKSALIGAQRTSGATGDGVYGPSTRSRLEWPSSAAENSCRIL